MARQKRRDAPPENERGRGRIGRPTSTPGPTQSESESAFSNGNGIADFRQTRVRPGPDVPPCAVSGVQPETSVLPNPDCDGLLPCPVRENITVGLREGPCPDCGSEISSSCSMPCAGPHDELCEPCFLDRRLPSGPLVYDSGWFFRGGIHMRVAFGEGQPNGALHDFLMQLLLSDAVVSACRSEGKSLSGTPTRWNPGKQNSFPIPVT